MRLGDLPIDRWPTVRLDENNTADPRSWALRPDVVAMLKAWVSHGKAKAADLMFVDVNQKAFADDTRSAELLRLDLETADVKKRRPELFSSTEKRKAIRAHDLRGTMVTLSLANRHTETWVSDRTGHRWTSQMINRYRRRSREAAELQLGRPTRRS